MEWSWGRRGGAAATEVEVDEEENVEGHRGVTGRKGEWSVCNFTGRGQQRPYTRSPAARPHRTARPVDAGVGMLSQLGRCRVCRGPAPQLMKVVTADNTSAAWERVLAIAVLSQLLRSADVLNKIATPSITPLG